MKRSTIVLLVAIAVFAVVLVVQRIDWSGEPEIAAWEGEPTRVTVNGPDASFALEKDEDRWILAEGGYPADSTKVENLLKQLRGIGQVEVVADGGPYERYDLEEDTAIRVTVTGSSGTLRDLYVGKSSSVGNKVYLRTAGDERVLLADGAVRKVVSTTGAEIRDHGVVDLAREGVERILLTAPDGETITVEPPDADAEKPAYESLPVGESDLNTFFRVVSALEADSFDTQAPEGEPVARLEVVRADRDPFVLAVYDGGENGYPATASSLSYPFVLNRTTVRSLFMGTEVSPVPSGSSAEA